MTKPQIETPLVLLPAAGFGRRNGSPPAKELFLHPKKNRPLIEVALKNCDHLNYQAHVILRSEKKELKNFLLQSRYRPQIQEVSPTEEWAATVLLSQAHWHHHNLLYLPDTEFEPLDILKDMVHSLTTTPVSFGVFEVDDPSLWGTIKGSTIGEKARGPKGPAVAWGVIGFTKEYGVQLFETILEAYRSRTYQPLSLEPKLFSLKSFDDLTRHSAP